MRLHHRIALALEDLGPRLAATPAELAYHFVESRHLDREGKAVDYCEQAALAASDALAYEEAKGHYEAALERLHDNPPRRCALLIGLGTAAARMGDPAAVAAFDEAAAIAQSEGLAEELGRAAVGRVGSYANAGAVDTEAIALLEAALAAQGSEETPLVAQILSRLANALHFTGDMDRVEELTIQAVGMAQRLGDPLALVGALESRHAALMHSNHLVERLRLATELYDLAERTGERELRMLGLHWRAYDLFEMGDVHGARRETRQLVALAEELRQPFYRHWVARWDVLWAMVADRIEEIPALIGRAHELGTRARAPEADLEAAGQQFAIAYRTGVLGQFAALLDAQLKENPQLVVNLPALALAHAQAGNLEESRAIFVRIAAGDFAGVPARHALARRHGDPRPGLRDPRRRAARAHPVHAAHAASRPQHPLRDGHDLGVDRAQARPAGDDPEGVRRGRRALRARPGAQRRRRHRLDVRDGPRRVRGDARAARGRRRPRARRRAARRDPQKRGPPIAATQIDLGR